ncbi:MAG TPA: Ldh family oxidoreductase [Xanthobacteraceae bacterium]|nr:Ldh family oxidoreductase [Xanthobacteraceae bacterium]
MSGSRIFVRHDDLARFIIAAFVAKGMAADDAATVADALVWANLRGGDSHGVVRLPRYVEVIATGDMDPAARPAFAFDSPTRFVLDGRRCAGPIAMAQATAAATERAKANGLCVGLVRHTTHTGAIGRYAQWAAERGAIAVIAVAGVPLMAYHGARVRSLSTSPLAIGVPSGRDPIVLDMATSVAALGRLVQARGGTAPIPDGWALAEDGTPTTDPKNAAIPLPLGGAKGSGLSLMFECLAGLLAGAPVLVPALGPERRSRHTQNAFILAIDIAGFRAPAEFAADADALIGLIKRLPVREGFDEILLPGERGRRIEAVRRATGIPIPPATWEALGRLARAVAIELPATVPAPKRGA